MRMAGLEPARVAPADFESAASAIPPHPRAVSIIHYFAGKVKLFFAGNAKFIMFDT